MAIYDGNSASTIDASKLIGGDHIDFYYLGSAKEFTLPPGEWLFECWGANGGGGSTNTATSRLGRGAYIRGVYRNTENKKLYINVGGAGTSFSTCSASTTKSGGFNGGGDVWCAVAATSGSKGTGGGASDIRLYNDTLYNRIIVAGGGSGYGASGGAGGGGGWGGFYNNTNITPPENTSALGGAFGTGGSLVQGGKAGTGGSGQTAGSFGKGGRGHTGNTGNWYCGGGGGGWYGGGGSANSTAATSGTQDTAGGGGSSYAWCSELATYATRLSSWALTTGDYLTNVWAAGNTYSGTNITKWNIDKTTTTVANLPGGDGNPYAYINTAFDPFNGNGFVRITKLPRMVYPKIYIKINGNMVELLSGNGLVSGGKSITLKTSETDLINFMDINDK